MKERPILFSGEMVRAILEERKTQTRRVVKGTALDWLQPGMFSPKYVADPANYLSPYGYAGDRLWVRETWQMVYERMDGQRFTHPIENARQRWVEYAASPRDEHEPPKWRPSIFMPRKYSRITLEVIDVRVERVQAISREDAKDEGMSSAWIWDSTRFEKHPEHFERSILNPRIANFSVLWDEINCKRGFGWEANPWVWVIEFGRC